jgi:hypothetical protein
MQVIKEAGGTFRLARTWPGGRSRERELKNRRDAPRLCPICTEHPKPAQGKYAQRQRPVRAPAPAPQLSQSARLPAYERGAASARRLIQQQIDAGFSGDRIAEAQARILSALIPERLRPEGREEARGYRETAEAMIAAHARASTPQAGIEDERGSGRATGTALAAASGVRAEPAGKTTWLTAALQDRIAGRPSMPDRLRPEPGKIFGLVCEIPERQLETRPERPHRVWSPHRPLSPHQGRETGYGSAPTRAPELPPDPEAE